MRASRPSPAPAPGIASGLLTRHVHAQRQKQSRGAVFRRARRVDNGATTRFRATVAMNSAPVASTCTGSVYSVMRHSLLPIRWSSSTGVQPVSSIGPRNDGGNGVSRAN